MLLKGCATFQTRTAPFLEARDVIGLAPAHICNQSGAFVRRRRRRCVGLRPPQVPEQQLGLSLKLHVCRRRLKSLRPTSGIPKGGEFQREQAPFVWEMDNVWDPRGPGRWWPPCCCQNNDTKTHARVCTLCVVKVPLGGGGGESLHGNSLIPCLFFLLLWKKKTQKSGKFPGSAGMRRVRFVIHRGRRSFDADS